MSQRLKPKDKVFIDAYFGMGPNGRPIKKRCNVASIKATGYTGKNAKQVGWRYKSIPRVSAEIERREAALEKRRREAPDNLTESEIFEKLKAIVEADLNMVITKDGHIDTSKIHHLGQALKSFEVREETRVDGTIFVTRKVSIVDIPKILIQLGKAHGMWKRRKPEDTNLESVGDSFKAQIGISQEALSQASKRIEELQRVRSEQYTGKEI